MKLINTTTSTEMATGIYLNGGIKLTPVGWIALANKLAVLKQQKEVNNGQ